MIGEGSSGGALGIGIGDHVAMSQYATYFVISPEGCSRIIWKTVEQAPEAARAMGLTVATLRRLGVVDAMIKEPLGGAHRDVDTMASNLSRHLRKQLRKLSAVPIEDLLERRHKRLMAYGRP